jgi:hypothetical protein
VVAGGADQHVSVERVDGAGDQGRDAHPYAIGVVVHGGQPAGVVHAQPVPAQHFLLVDPAVQIVDQV